MDTTNDPTYAGPTHQLARWASNLKFETLPPDVVANAKLSILDSIGCGLYGSAQPWGQIAADVSSIQSPGGAVSMWGHERTAGVADAAFANGTAVHGFEVDDVHQLSLMHPGSVTVPAAMALSEFAGVNGSDFLVSVIAGFEVGLRVGSLTSTPHMLRGFHPTGTVGSLCASVAAGKVLGLGPESMRNALAIGATQAAGLYCASKTGAMVKRMHAGRAAQSGVLAALLAQRGFTGSLHALEDPSGGFMSTLAAGEDLQPRLEDLGKDWETLRIGFKAYAACASAHTIVDALDQLMRQGASANKIQSLKIQLSKIGMNNVGWPYRPAGVVSAQMNAQYVAASKLLHGEVFVDQFKEECLSDPRILALIEKIRVEHDPTIDAQGAHARHASRVSASMENGFVLEAYVEQRRGSVDHPMRTAEVLEKFHKLAGQILPPASVDVIADKVLAIETTADMAQIAELLRLH